MSLKDYEPRIAKSALHRREEHVKQVFRDQVAEAAGLLEMCIRDRHHLGLRVAKAAVVLDDLGAVGGQHQAKVKAALKGAALGLHGGHGRQENLLHAAVGHGLSLIHI